MIQANHGYGVANTLDSLRITLNSLARMDFVELQRIAKIEGYYIPNAAKGEFDGLRRAARRSAAASTTADRDGHSKEASRATTATKNSLAKSARPADLSREHHARSRIVDRVQAMKQLVQLAEQASGLAKSNETLDEFATNVGKDLAAYVAGLEVEAQYASDATAAEIYAPLIVINDMARAFLVFGTTQRVMADEAAKVVMAAAARTNKYRQYDN
ncbi:MAG: hypothetical protein HQ526_00630 [Actinobacteria bacterium]|nr:hypothetical protein [Actinomycetota bacterium]